MARSGLREEAAARAVTRGCRPVATYAEDRGCSSSGGARAKAGGDRRGDVVEHVRRSGGRGCQLFHELPMESFYPSRARPNPK